MMGAIVIGFSGKIGSGKTTLSRHIAESLGWPRVSFGDYVRQVATQQNLDGSRQTLQAIGASLVEKDVTAFCRSVLEQAAWQPGHSLVIDGIRHAEVIHEMQKLVHPSQFSLIHIETDEATRLMRFSDASESLEAIESHSTETQVHSDLPRLADLTIDGNMPINAASNEVLRWVQTLA